MKEALSFLTELLRFIRFVKRTKAGDVIVKTAEIYDNMRMLTTDLSHGIGRVLVLYAHNGGFDLQTGRPAYATCLHEEVRAPFTSVKADYQKIPIDGPYIDMLKQIYLNGYTNINVASMSPCLLKNIYERENVKHARVYFLKHSKEALWYISIASDGDATFDTPKTAVALTRAVSNIKTRL